MNIYEACKKGNIGVVKVLVENGVDVNEGRNVSTPLDIAIECHNLELVKYLVEKGADVNAKSWLGDTMLMKAAAIGYLEIVKYLVENGADANARSDHDRTALMIAVESDDFEVVRYLVEKGADVNKQDFYDVTALMTAAKYGYVDIARYLVKNGADIRIKSKLGYVARDWAIENNRKEIADCLDDVAMFLDSPRDIENKLQKAIDLCNEVKVLLNNKKEK